MAAGVVENRGGETLGTMPVRDYFVDMAAECIRNKPIGVPIEKYKAEVMQPLFRRLASDCLETRPEYPLAFVQGWVAGRQETVCSTTLAWAEVCDETGDANDDEDASMRRRSPDHGRLRPSSALPHLRAWCQAEQVHVERRQRRPQTAITREAWDKWNGSQNPNRPSTAPTDSLSERVSPLILSVAGKAPKCGSRDAVIEGLHEVEDLRPRFDEADSSGAMRPHSLVGYTEDVAHASWRTTTVLHWRPGSPKDSKPSTQALMDDPSLWEGLVQEDDDDDAAPVDASFSFHKPSHRPQSSRPQSSTAYTTNRAALFADSSDAEIRCLRQRIADIEGILASTALGRCALMAVNNKEKLELDQLIGGAFVSAAAPCDSRLSSRPASVHSRVEDPRVEGPLPPAIEVNLGILSADDLLQELSRRGAVAAQTPLQEGTIVLLHGLQDASAYNGLEGTCLYFAEGSRRWIVELQSGEKKNLKTANLVSVQDSRGDLAHLCVEGHDSIRFVEIAVQASGFEGNDVSGDATGSSADGDDADALKLLGAVLRRLREQGVSSATQVFAYFGPDAASDSAISAGKLRAGFERLNAITASETARLVNRLDRQGLGQVTYDDFCAAVVAFLSQSKDFHHLLSANEFSAIIARMQVKLSQQGLSISHAFLGMNFAKNCELLEKAEFTAGLERLQLGLSGKEISQLFNALEAQSSGGSPGQVSFAALDTAVKGAVLCVGGVQENPLKEWAVEIFASAGLALRARAVEDAVRRCATGPQGAYMPYVNFATLMCGALPLLSYAEVGRMWCALDKHDGAGEALVQIDELIRWLKLPCPDSSCAIQAMISKSQTVAVQ